MSTKLVDIIDCCPQSLYVYVLFIPESGSIEVAQNQPEYIYIYIHSSEAKSRKSAPPAGPSGAASGGPPSPAGEAVVAAQPRHTIVLFGLSVLFDPSVLFGLSVLAAAAANTHGTGAQRASTQPYRRGFLGTPKGDSLMSQRGCSEVPEGLLGSPNGLARKSQRGCSEPKGVTRKAQRGCSEHPKGFPGSPEGVARKSHRSPKGLL